MRVVVRLKYRLIAAVVAVLLLASHAVEPVDGQPHEADWRLLKDVLGEIAAALVGALVTIYLVDTANKHELRESVEENLRAELARFQGERDRYGQLRGEIETELTKLRLLGEDFRTDMQSTVLYKAFCYWPDRAMVENLNRRIFAKPLIRTRQQVTCTVLKGGSGPPGTVDMRFAYVIQYQNLSATPETNNPFKLYLDEKLVLDSARPGAAIEFIDVAVFKPRKTTPEKIHHVDLAGLRVERLSANRVFCFSLDRHDSLFTVEPERLLEWRYAYLVRHPCRGNENFVLRELTSYFVFDVMHEHDAAATVTLNALTDAPGPWRPTRRDGLLQLEITDMLLPRQGIAFSWDFGGRTAANDGT